MYLTSSKDVMRVRGEPVALPRLGDSLQVFPLPVIEVTPDVERAESTESIDFSNGKIVTAIGSVIWLIMLGANVYVIIRLVMGKN